MNATRGTSRSKVSLWATAYHEAGHAVANVRLNIALRRVGVTIVPDKAAGNVGSCAHRRLIGSEIEYGHSGKNIHRAERQVQSLLAGEIAQRRYNPRTVRHHQARSDREKAIDMLLCFTNSEREVEAWLRLLHIRTENMLSNPDVWRAVERLAAELMRRETIRGKEATGIIVEGFNESFYSQHPEIRSQDLALAARLKRGVRS